MHPSSIGILIAFMLAICFFFIELLTGLNLTARTPKVIDTYVESKGGKLLYRQPIGNIRSLGDSRYRPATAGLAFTYKDKKGRIHNGICSTPGIRPHRIIEDHIVE